MPSDKAPKAVGTPVTVPGETKAAGALRMFWSKEKVTPHLPRTWSPEFWETLFGKDDTFHCLILIRAMKKRQEWIYENLNLSGTAEYYGGLGHDDNSPAEHLRVTLGFDVSGGPTGTARLRQNAIGCVSTQEWTKTYDAPVYLSVTIRSAQEGADEFERVFHRAKANGQDFVPLWLWGRGQVRVTSEDGRFGLIQPLDRISFQQRVSLLGKMQQDE
jgi:hypothetical protein